MASNVEKTTEINEVRIEDQSLGNKDASTFIYEDPKNAPKKTAAERKLVWKVDLLIDRGNIGNARVMGFQEDLHITDGQFYNIVSLYYVGYVLCTFPANLTVRFIKPHRQIGACVMLFATLSCCMAAAKNAGTVLALRILFGFVSAFLQALTLYTSMWYKRNELATRIGCFYSAATIAGGFSGLIAYAIQKNLDGALGRPAWQWLFIIEGVAGIFVGLACWILLPPSPDQLKKNHWLFTDEEIEIAIQRMQTYNTKDAHFEWNQIWLAIKEPKTIPFCLMMAGVSLALASISAFLPTFIRQFGYSLVRTQLFSVIPYACAFVALIGINFASDRFNRKGLFLMGLLCTSSTGYIILIAVHNVKVKIFAACLITMGTFPSVTMGGTWININTGGFTKRASTWGLCEIFAQCFSILGSHIYTDPPQFIKGHSIALSFDLLSLASVIGLWLYMRLLNRQRDRVAENHASSGTIHPDLHKSLEDVQDNHPSFRYIS